MTATVHASTTRRRIPENTHPKTSRLTLGEFGNRCAIASSACVERLLPKAASARRILARTHFYRDGSCALVALEEQSRRGYLLVLRRSTLRTRPCGCRFLQASQTDWRSARLIRSCGKRLRGMCEPGLQTYTLPCSQQDAVTLRDDARACALSSRNLGAPLAICKALRARGRRSHAAFEAATSNPCVEQALSGDPASAPPDLPALIRRLEAVVSSGRDDAHKVSKAAAALALLRQLSLWRPSGARPDVESAVQSAQRRAGSSAAVSEAEGRERLLALCESDAPIPSSLRVQSAGGSALTPDEGPESGSWNAFHTFKRLKGAAFRRAHPGEMQERIAKGLMTHAEAQQRLDKELDTTLKLATAGVGPAVLAQRKDYHAGERDGSLPLHTYTTMPERYEGSVRSYLRKGGRAGRLEASQLGELIVAQAFRTADMGYCHLDLKFENMVWRRQNTSSATRPLDLRFIDFDPKYMRDISEDAPLVRALAGHLATSKAVACNVVRLFYVVLMLLSVRMQAEKILLRLKGDGGKAAAAERGRVRAVKRALSQALRTFYGPFDSFFGASVRDAALLDLACERMYNYKYSGSRAIANSAPAVVDAQKALAHAATRGARTAAREKIRQARVQALLPVLRGEIREALGSAHAPVSELAARGQRPFTSSSSGWGDGRRSFQTAEYAATCGTGGVKGLTVLRDPDPLPPGVPLIVGPRTLGALERLQRATQDAYLFLQTERARSGSGRDAERSEALAALRELLSSHPTSGARGVHAESSEAEGHVAAEIEEARLLDERAAAVRSALESLSLGAAAAR